MNEIAYKAYKLIHRTNTIILLHESFYKEECDRICYEDKMEEPAPDKDLVYTWIVIRTYTFNTDLLKEEG